MYFDFVVCVGLLISLMASAECSWIKKSLASHRSYKKRNALKVQCMDANSGWHDINLPQSAIQHLQREALKEYGQCDFLYLNDQHINEIETGAFLGLDQLTSLDLRQNNLKSVHSGMWKGLDLLESLILRNNKISSLSGGSFDGLENLEKLDLEGNGLKNIRKDMWAGIDYLQELILDSNNFATLPANGFSGLYSLKTLSLQKCGIATIQAKAFSGVPSLSNLKLNGNSFTTFDRDIFDLTDHDLPLVNLGTNPISCGKNLCWVSHEASHARIHTDIHDTRLKCKDSDMTVLEFFESPLCEGEI